MRAMATSSRSTRRRAQIANVTQGKTYDPVPLTPKEDEIRRSGGIFAIGRREFRSSVERTPEVVFPDADARAADVDDRADRLGASRRQGRRGQAGRDASRLCRPAAGVGRHGAVCDSHLQSDHRRQHDRSAAGGHRQRSLRVHRQARRRQADGDRPAVRGAARDREAVLRDAGRRHLPLLLSRAGPGGAGAVHSRRRLALARLRRLRRGRHRRRIDDARLRLVDRLHLLHDGQAAPRAIHRPAAALGHRQGHRPRAAAPMGRAAVAGHVGGARRRRSAAADRVSQHDREHDGRGRGAERHLRARRDHRTRGTARRA